MEITFVNLLNIANKESYLHDVIMKAACGNAVPCLFVVQDDLFRAIEGYPFAYNAPRQMLLLSARRQILSANGIIARQGIGASTRFHRLIWEAPADRIGHDWLHMAHGTSPSKFYKPTTHLFLWASNGKEAKADVLNRYPYLKGNYGFKIQAEEFYGKYGLCYGKRTENFTVQVLPSEHVFSFEGTAIFTDGTLLDDWSLLALLNSAPIKHWLSITCAEHKAYNYVEAIPIPANARESSTLLKKEAQEGWKLQQSLDVYNLTSPFFATTALITFENKSISLATEVFNEHIGKIKGALQGIQDRIDDISIRLYGLSDTSLVSENDKEPSDNEHDVKAEGEDEDSIDTEAEETISFDPLALTAQFVDYLGGVAFGRWDIRLATGERQTPALRDPFAPLPSCPPGMLQNAEGLPAEPKDVPHSYPIRISWSGILVDDENHPEDIINRVREVLEVIWKDQADAIEQEACEILGVKTLRDYFRKPSGFFADHLKRYSKSRRQAPIYWPLSTKSGSYTLWIYYHRLTDQTLYKCINDFINPKIEDVGRGIEKLQSDIARGANAKQKEELADQMDFLQELKDFRDELLRIAQLPYKPNLNDGVLITASPLHNLFSLPKWKKDLEECWKKLNDAEYDWAHLAYSIWPDRVKQACKNDRSIAIAHGLENLCEIKAPEKKTKKKKAAEDKPAAEKKGKKKSAGADALAKMGLGFE